MRRLQKFDLECPIRQSLAGSVAGSGSAKGTAARRRATALAVPVLWLALSAAPLPAEPESNLLRVETPAGQAGGRLVVALRAEPKTLNPVAPVDSPTLTVIRRLTADLIHIDRDTQRTSPALAESWSTSADGRDFRLELRRGVRFSDGHAFDADDVVFTFEVLLDEKISAPHRGLLIVGGEPIAVRKLGSHTVEFKLAAPYAVAERLFDSIPILPRHRLETAYREGRFAEAWGLSTAAGEIAGLGPYRFKSYVPGERLELERNPHYWKVDREGRVLPYLDGITFVFVASEDAQVIRFQAGETHLISRLGARNFALLEREQERKGHVLKDLGSGLNHNFLFFNLNDLAGKELSEIEAKQAWFGKLVFRQAVSAAIDRAGIVRVVYGGRATPIATLVTPGNKLWLNHRLAPPAHSPRAARQLLQAAGFTWDGQGRLRDAAGKPVSFSIVTNASNSERMGIATIIQEDLDRLGMEVHVVGLEFRALIDRIFNSFEYEACILGFGGGDGDPNSSIPILTSGGGTHLWRLGGGGTVAPWQAEIDHLMERQLATIDPGRRKKLYDRVQELVAENVPMVFLVSPNVLTGAARGLGNFRPAILDHFTLWNVDELFWRGDAEH